MNTSWVRGEISFSLFHNHSADGRVACSADQSNAATTAGHCATTFTCRRLLGDGLRVSNGVKATVSGCRRIGVTGISCLQ